MYISVVTLYVDDMDRAIDFYTGALGWEKTRDTQMGPDTRWVTIAPPGAQTAFTLSIRSPQDKSADLFSGVILDVDDVYRTHEELVKHAVRLTEAPRNEPWGAWAMFKDSEGNIHGLRSPAVASGPHA